MKSLIFTAITLATTLVFAEATPIVECALSSPKNNFGFSMITVSCESTESLGQRIYSSPIEMQGCVVNYHLPSGLMVTTGARVFSEGKYIGKSESFKVVPDKYPMTEGQDKHPMGFWLTRGYNLVEASSITYCYPDEKVLKSNCGDMPNSMTLCN